MIDDDDGGLDDVMSRPSSKSSKSTRCDDYEYNDDDEFYSKSAKSGSYNSLLNQAEGYTLARASNSAENDRIRKQYMWSIAAVLLLPLVI